MKCQECGYELQEGKLYCEHCGKEVQIVPVFDSEIENSIHETLSAVVEEFQGQEEAAAQHTGLFSIFSKIRANRKLAYLISAVTLICMVSLLTFVIVLIYRSHSYSFQMSRAAECAVKQDYPQAIYYANRALELDNEDIAVRLLLADYYEKSDEKDRAKVVLREVISMDASNEEAYRKLIHLYETEQDYEAINRLLLASDSKEVVKTFQNYIAYPPEFDCAEGNYNEVIALKLSAGSSGEIYYTVDGSKPDVHGQLYTSPLILESGSYRIRAVFINEFGVSSEVAEKYYYIDVAIPQAPEITPASGNYDKPVMITVSVPPQCSVYYTIDGSLPTQDSILYSNPIAMPMGSSRYRFIAYSKDGIGGEVVTVNYNLEVNTVVSVGEAVNLLVPFLQEKGVIADYNGNLTDKAGHNVYIASTIVEVAGEYYYLVAEYYVDLLDVYTRTGNIYGVGANNGILYKIVVNADGSYTPVAFQ